MKIFAWIMLIISALIGIGGLGMDTTVPTVMGTRVHNLGLMQQQQNMIMVAMFGIVVALILFFFARKKATAADQGQALQIPANSLRPCPFCAEPIRKEAIKCKHCGSAVDAVVDSAEHAPKADDEELMAHYGITFERGLYRYKGAGHETLKSAIDEAQGSRQMQL